MLRYFAKHSIQIALGLVLTGLFVWLQTTGQSAVRTLIGRLDYLAYDLRLNQTLPPAIETPRVFIIDIDEESLRMEGRWPWSREKMGRLVANLKAKGVYAIGFDVAFAEPERNVAQELIDATASSDDAEFTAQLEQLIPDMDRDQAFAAYLKGQNVVLGFLFHASDEESVGKLPSGWSFVPPEQSDTLSVPTMTSYTGNLKVLQKAARYGGYLNTTPDSDGVIRATPLVLRHKNMIYPSLSLAMARRYLDAKRFKLETVDLEDSIAVTGLRMETMLIPTDRYGRVLVPYLGPRGRIPYIPATRIIQAGPERFHVSAVGRSISDGKRPVRWAGNVQDVTNLPLLRPGRVR